MKRIHTTVFVFLLAICSAISQNSDFDMSQIYPIEGSHSYVGFSIKYMGFAMVKGRFAKFNGSIRYDEEDINKTSVTFVVDVSSIDTNHEWRDNDLKSDNWFDAETYPKMHFISQKVEKTAAGFNLIGELTIKEVTKTVTIEMAPPSGVLKDTRGDAQVIFNGSLKLSRKEFGVKGERWSKIKESITAVSDEVNLELIILGKQIKKNNFKNWVRDPERPQGKLYQIANTEGVAAALKAFDEMRADTTENTIKAGHLNIAAHMFLLEEKFDTAIQLFEANLKAFPEDSNTYDSYAGALVSAGKFEEAAKYYKKALEKNPDNMNAQEVLRHL